MARRGARGILPVVPQNDSGKTARGLVRLARPAENRFPLVIIPQLRLRNFQWRQFLSKTDSNTHSTKGDRIEQYGKFQSRKVQL
jgi:hypothetical protein